jgi:hypothetical protein
MFGRTFAPALDSVPVLSSFSKCSCHSPALHSSTDVVHSRIAPPRAPQPLLLYCMHKVHDRKSATHRLQCSNGEKSGDDKGHSQPYSACTVQSSRCTKFSDDESAGLHLDYELRMSVCSLHAF